jgi:hypothetical protein
MTYIPSDCSSNVRCSKVNSLKPLRRLSNSPASGAGWVGWGSLGAGCVLATGWWTAGAKLVAVAGGC